MSKPFHVYLDLDVFNNSTDFTSKAPQLSFEETRTQPFLDGTADDYFVAIARFSIQTGSTLPVFIPAIDTSQSDPNKTVYKITLMYKGASASATIIYTPQPSHDAVAPPNGPNGQDFSGNYYYIYDYQDWITMVNKALLQAHILLISHVRAQIPLDGFIGLPAFYTETITLPSANPFTYTTPTPPYPASAAPTVFTNTSSVTTSVLVTGPSTVGGIPLYTVAISISLINGQYAATTTNVRSDPINTNTSTPLSTGGMTITTSLTSTATPQAQPPFMQIDLTTLTCVLNADALWYDTTQVVGSASIYFNTRLHQLFAGFPSTFLGYSTDTYNFTQPDGTTAPNVIGDRNFQIKTNNNNFANTLSVNNNGTTQKYIQAFQEINSVGLWNPVASIVFTSTTLPIHPTLTSPPKIYNSNSTGLAGAGSTNLTNILSDFEIAISNTNQYRPEIAYAPPGEYRLIDMYSNSNLSKIDLNVYWKDRYGNLKPLRLQPGCSASVKLLFRHKHFYLGVE
jgi:hypothetical protein